jgi:hypothetical protein
MRYQMFQPQDGGIFFRGCAHHLPKAFFQRTLTGMKLGGQGFYAKQAMAVMDHG